MQIPKNWDTTQAFDGEFDSMTAGGHVCKILQANVVPTQSGKEQLVLAMDVAEGSKFDGYYAKDFERRKAKNQYAKWPCVLRQFVLDNNGECNPYFKGLITCVEKSNPGFVWHWDEKTLKDKLIGIIFREEEFENQQGGISTVVRPAFVRSVEKIREGVEVPEVKRLNKSGSAANNGFVQVADDELPF